MSHHPLLEVTDLKVQFFTETGTVRAVDGISFEVRAGEIVGLVGESGAGKSVAVSSVLGLIEEPGQIVAGEIRYRGDRIYAVEPGPDGDPQPTDDSLSEAELREQIRGNEIAIILQDPMESLNPVFTIGEQLREVIELNRDLDGRAAKTEAIDMLRDVGIPDPKRSYEDYPHEFSGGQRQRVMIAMALGCRPGLIVADEPTTALDVTVEGQILDLVDDLKDEYATSFIWVTHDMSVVAEICDRVNVMYLGEIVESAPVEELFAETKHPYTEALLRSVPRPDVDQETIESIPGLMPSAKDAPRGCRFHTRCPDAREICTEVRPEPRPPTTDADGTHTVSCVKYDTFDVPYETSPPIENDASSPSARHE